MSRPRIEVRKKLPDGRTFRRYFPNPTVAKNVRTQIEAAIANGNWLDLMVKLEFHHDDRPTLAQFSGRFLEEYAKPRLKSWNRYECCLRKICESLGRIKLDQLRRESVYSWMRKRTREVSNATANRDVAALKKLMAWALEIGAIERNPLAGFRLLPEERKERRPLSYEEYLVLIDRAPNDLSQLFITVTGETGCRRSEALGLKWEDLDFATRTVTLNKVKNGRARVVPMSPRLEGALKQRLVTAGWQGTHVLTNPHTRKPLTDPKRAFERASKAAGVPWLRMATDSRHAALQSHSVGRSRSARSRHPEAPWGILNLKTTMRYLQHRDPAFKLVQAAFASEQECELRGRQMGDTP